ncbi:MULTISPECIES: single-stranded-DNA-specific exonuclease RecJ [Bacillus cereus group]|uniref:single-stranded-DNA-specific exonuclease RecJ n=1 Tax=Bacillus cereus group TaxID=86661 RepID=UPI0018CDE67B|nr:MULTISPECIES: single-stranded-DNA-specific exonuclease RecJ [Bacillus cereus group]MBG9840102.1 single-stranded DNA exonuclease RecJ [Bacillus tropicus]MBG9875710.1 single-stranded DNA exonuclease RecJ [Bacillus tropicus]MBG9919723.1 single-stranded DNA exonuclease RecJ [Bacillus tropicus]MBJ8351338.1 single-stranded-DNA-specific exonuclease RecJ [Bacillus mycoides]MED2899415.1 single-stranded-DNA-specific exonuclease RecJ [Bacillus tropicus]
MEGFFILHWIQQDKDLEEHPNKARIMYFARSFNLPPLLIQYLFFHNIKNWQDIYQFLYPSIDNLYNPFLCNDMRKAVTRILNAISNKENIFIFGDYDCDGITSTTLLFQCLKSLGANVDFKLPLREEGYGLTSTAVHTIIDKNISLIITVDNGSSAHDAMKIAKQYGIDVIVTDHHEIIGKHPDCYAFINPKRTDSTYPFSDLAGVGVAFKLAHALHITTQTNWNQSYSNYIELAALGTIADLMPLSDENRIICHLGLRKINTNPSHAFKLILDTMKRNQITSSTIGYQIAPLFNALGRIADPNLAVHVLTDIHMNEKSISKLFQLNEKRKQMTISQFSECQRIIHSKQLHANHVIVVHGEFHHGLIGILASKITEIYQKPAIVISNNGTGSCRSVNGTNFSIINTLSRCSEHLSKYGGHQAAAGFSIEMKEEVLENFHQNIQISATHEEPIMPTKLYFNKHCPNEFVQYLYPEIFLLEPFGQRFEQPIFLSPPLQIERLETFGANKNHLRLYLPTNECFYLFNSNSDNHHFYEQPYQYFYTPTLAKPNEFIIHGIHR